MKPQVCVHASNDQVNLAWQYESPIPDCIGFAVFRRRNNESADVAEPLTNRIGFAGEPFTPGEQRPSTEWPIQKFTWVDFALQPGDSASYLILPMLWQNNALVKDEADASDWTDPVTTQTGTTYRAFFNRGIISSQFVSRFLLSDSSPLTTTSVRAVVNGPDSELRGLLGGSLAKALFDLLDEITADPTLSLYTALYELAQPDLIDRLVKLGGRANVILANGTGSGDGNDENAAARATLKAAGVPVADRMVNTSEHFAHNKFLVVCRNGEPERVWTGSTNWTPNGLFAQVNNGLLIADADLAKIYRQEWDAIHQAANDYPPQLAAGNARAFVANDDLRVWFCPTQAEADLNDAKGLIDNAQDGILFLMFNPGPADTLFNEILSVQQSKPDLFIHGVINQDPGGSKNPLVFFHRGQPNPADWDTIIPKNLKTQAGFWDQEVTPMMVTIHSKVVILDPFGANPVVMTGSHNLGPKASRANDDNLVIIRDAQLAREYAVEIMTVYEHYRWRYAVANQASGFKGLVKNPDWMAKTLAQAPVRQELNFWMGA
jgi:phosphatidylserine/phosphatidylglycerophosphate/cardiolipin synthase-like enzyme